MPNEVEKEPEEKILDEAQAILKLRQEQSSRAISDATPQQIAVRDVPLDDDLADLFSGASSAEFQQLVLLLEINRRTARLVAKLLDGSP